MSLAWIICQSSEVASDNTAKGQGPEQSGLPDVNKDDNLHRSVRKES
jgi:hypothetical protein